MGFSSPNCTFIQRESGYIALRFCSLRSQLDTRHAFSGGVSLRALDPDPPPFLSDPPAPLSAASSPTAITDAVHETSALWLRRARRIDAAHSLAQGVLVVCARPLEHGECLRTGSTPPRTPAHPSHRSPRAPSFTCPPPLLHALWRASSPPSMTGVVHFAPSASARCREHTCRAPMPPGAGCILRAYVWLIHGAVGLLDVYGQDGRPSCTGVESIALARITTASNATRAHDSLPHILGLARRALGVTHLSP
ncbi:hypothetical protein DFH09DRAFT_1317038 [Mycena vulgaris]|nr:hypothetical protein DFH09DRAFT_1317038 [Mycena vulgaris]